MTSVIAGSGRKTGKTDDVGNTGGSKGQGVISVIIPHFNQPDLLEKCLASIAGQARAAEVIVVDNGSTVGPEPVLARYPAVRLLTETAPGPGLARNLGAAAAKGEVLAFIDADCVAAPDWLAAMETVFSDPAVMIAGGEVLILHRNPTRPTAYEGYESEFAFRQEFYVLRENYAATCNLAVRRAALDRVGGFGGITIAEDRDWGHRATALGLPIRWAPGMVVYHPARETFAELARKWDRLTAHAYEMQARGAGGRLRWLIKGVAMAFSPPAALPRILRSARIGGGWGGRLRAFAVLVRIRLYRAKLMLRLWRQGGTKGMAGRWRDQG